MAAPSNVPIYSRVGDVQWAAPLTTANTAMDGTGTVSTVFTADATNGGFVQKLRLRPAGTNVATVLRVFINNGSTNTVATNNTLFEEISLPSISGAAAAATAGFEVPLGFALPPGYKINVTLGTTVVGGWVPTIIGGKY